MRDYDHEIADLGGRVAVISFASPAQLKSFAEHLGHPFLWLADPKRVSYRHLGPRRRGPLSIAPPRVIWGYVRLILLRGRRWRPGQLDWAQMGGDFVFDPGGNLSLDHVSTSSDDRPSVEAVMAALRLAAASPIRRATLDDAAAVGEIFIRARDLMTYLPRVPDQDRPKLGQIFCSRYEGWIIEKAGRPAGYLAIAAGAVEHLYVDPDFQGQGLGTRLLEFAKKREPGGLTLSVFQQNAGARRFYERHGFVLDRLTDGADNMEHEPDALYRWPADVAVEPV